MTRDEFDALVTVACTAIAAKGATKQEAAALVEEAQLLDAEARSFADAVDRDGKRIDYGAAVVLEGANGFVVVTVTDFDRTPAYWRTVAGRLDRLTEGPELLSVLQAAANSATPPRPGAH